MLYFLYLAGAFIEILGITISVIGVGQLVGMNLIIILMAISFDIGKIATVSLLQRNWGSFNFVMRAYGMVAIFVTMMITSFGAAGFLTTAMQNGIANVEKIETQLSVLQQEKERLISRKKQIDDQIANIPPDASIRIRNSIFNGYQQEQQRVTDRITELDTKIPELQLQKIDGGGKASGIVSMAKSLGMEPNELIRYLVILIVFVFDPFAIYLIISANHMMNKTRHAMVDKSPTPEPPVVEPEAVENDNSSKTTSATQLAKEEDDVVGQQQQQQVIPSDPPLPANSEEEVVVSEFETPLTFPPVPSILEAIPVQPGLFENDLNLPSQIIGVYSNKKFIHQTPKGVEL